MGSEDRDYRNREKSWREIDAMRDKKHERREPSESEKKAQKREHSSAYAQYKKDLENVFSGGEIPEYLKEKLPEGQAGKGVLQLQAAIKKATDNPELIQAVKAYLAKNSEFPDDPELLRSLLDCGDESVLLKVVPQLSRYASVMPLPHKQQFLLKLDSLAMTVTDPALGDAIDELLASLR